MPHNRNDFQSPFFHDTQDIAFTPSPNTKMARPDMNKNISNNSSDNARESIYQNPLKPLKVAQERTGILSFDRNDNIWKYDDTTLMNSVRKKVAAKHMIDQSQITVTIDRQSCQIRYQCHMFGKMKLNDGIVISKMKLLTFSEIPNNSEIKLAEEDYDDWVKTEQGNSYRNFVTINDIWIKDSETQIHLKKDERIIRKVSDKYLKERPYSSILPEAFYDDQKAEETVVKKFDDLMEKDKFVFEKLPNKIRDKAESDTVFTKRGQKAVSDKTTYSASPDDKVIPYAVWEQKYKHKKDKFESMLSGLFSEYKITKTNLGDEITLSKEDFFEEFKDTNMTMSQLQKMSKITKQGKEEIMSGHYNGVRDDFAFVIGLKEVNIVRL